MRKMHMVLVLAALMAAGMARAAEQETWELRGGQSWEKLPSTAPATQPATDPTLARVEQLITQHQNLPAKRLCAFWLRSHPTSPLRDRGLYLLGQANFRYGDRIRSFYNFDELLDKFPASPLFYPALERQYEIADDFLKGYKRRFLGIPLFHAKEEAVEMLFRIQQRSPGSPLAEKSLLRTGDYYFEDSQFDLAADVYTVFLKTYPRSPFVPRVKLRQAFSNYAQFRGLRFDATPIVDAREQLLQITAQYPELAREENLAPVIERIDTSFARKIYITADWYQRTHELKAAVYNFRYLMQSYPDSEEAAAAKHRLDHMPKWALAGDPPPQSETGYAPTTLPNTVDVTPKTGRKR